MNQIWESQRERNGRAYGHDDFRIGIAAVYSGHSLRWGVRFLELIISASPHLRLGSTVEEILHANHGAFG